ncbi:hypothetical protein [Acinetobacter pollinis]|uniref:hypothetical protein n=1 Tax=Acinetobacter pollinis TaxID=2605270 RepID=UPI0018A2592B|nr:hypothetical protein [Acinetobacter pollinis]MBF7691697.1 hypothetical protein [Acinetobacter pollinis]MBF7699346.1 hypothetical protein [Acinetobacter pollinis]
MMGKFNRLWLILTLLLSLCACHLNEKTNMNHDYTLHFGMQGIQDFAKYSKTPVDQQAGIMSFYSLDFPVKTLGKVTVVNGEDTMVLDNVFAVMGTQMFDDLKYGIQILDIDAGLNKEEFVTPEQAYQAYVNIMHQLNEKGWKNYVYPFEPRIAKEDNLKYFANSSNIIDPTHILSFEEWQWCFKKKYSLFYRLYRNGILTDLTISKKPSRETADHQIQEQYMLRCSFQTIRYDERNTISNSDKMTPAELEQAFKKNRDEDKKLRAGEEEKFKAKGYRIDTEYQNPDVWQYVK